MERFYKGQLVTYDNHRGYVNFISEHYITVCIGENKLSKECAAHSKRNTRQICLCVTPDRWDKVIITQQPLK